MKLKKFVGACVAYVVVTFLFAVVWHLLLFKDLYRELAVFSRGDDPNMLLVFASVLIQGAILAYLYPLVSRGEKPIWDGIKFGLLMGIFLASTAVLAEGAKQNVTSLTTFVVMESLFCLIYFALYGLVVGLVYGRNVARSI